MSKIPVRCLDCEHLREVVHHWCPVTGKRVAGPLYRRRCNSFEPWPCFIPPHGNVIEDHPPPLRLWDGCQWTEIPRPRYMAALQCPRRH